MDADLIHSRLTDATSERREVILLLRGAHTLSLRSASVQASMSGDEACFDITGDIGIDGAPHRTGHVSVTSSDVACVFVSSPPTG